MEKVLSKTGAVSVLLFLYSVSEKQNRMQIKANVSANPTTVGSTLEILENHSLIVTEKGHLFNQSFSMLTPKGRQVAGMLQEIESLL